MIEAANVPHARRVLELGPGTGAITEVIHDCLPSSAQFLGLDLNEVFVRQLQRRFPNHEFVCSAAQSFDFDSWLNHGEYLFHSVPTKADGSYNLREAANLGKSTGSHGCIRLSVPDAKWMEQNLPEGTKVVIDDN